MQPVVELVILHALTALDALFHHAVLDAFDLTAPSPANLAHIDGIGENLANGGIAPRTAVTRGNRQIVQCVGNLLGARPVQKQVEHLFHHLRFLRMRLQRIALLARQLQPAVAVGRDAGDILSLRSRAVPPANQTAGDGLILPAAHEQAKFKVFLVKFIAGVVDLGRGDNLGAGKLKYLADIRLIGAVAARQALQVYHQHPGVQSCVDLLQQLLNLRPCGNGFAGDDLIIGFGHAVPALSCQTVQNGLVPLERFFHTHFSIIPVEAGFSEILCVLLHARLPSLSGSKAGYRPSAVRLR